MYFIIFIIAVILTSANSLAVNRIVGGRPVRISDFPYQVTILANNSFYCGGSIISKNYVLSAAHCFPPEDSFIYSVRAGSNSANHGGSVHKVVKVMAHENFENFDYLRSGREKSSYLRDVAVARIYPPFQFDKTRQPVRLFRSGEQVKPGDLLTVSGFGSVSEDGPDSVGLTAVTVPVVDWQLCEDKLSHYDEPLEQDCFCAGDLQGGKDHCYGDSGGPGVIGGRQAGIVSWGVGCGRPQSPGVYINVAEEMEWIEKKLGAGVLL